MDFNLILLLTSFLAGVLTVLTPCVLPILPVVLSGSIIEKNRARPFIIITSLVLSVFVFTLLLKTSALLIDVPFEFWQVVSGLIIFIFGLTLVFPKAWERLTLRFSNKSNQALSAAQKRRSTLGLVLLGAALGPVFSSCSPTYFIIIATVLPQSFSLGIIYLLSYVIGLAFILVLIALLGRKIINKLKWAANPKSWFRGFLGFLMIAFGILIMTGLEQKIELAVLNSRLGSINLEEAILNKLDMSEETKNLNLNNMELPFLYRAPELDGLTNWINSEPIESMQDLKGKVVLIDFWTYSCINCIRTLPHIQELHENYADDGLVIIGVHAPEFQFEKKIENVQNAVDEYGLTYPVVQDNDFTLWRAYANRYWPAKYLIDQNGYVRYAHFGEGKYEETEEAILKLLNKNSETGEVKTDSPNFQKIGTPETYLGTARRSGYRPDSKELNLNEWTLGGNWEHDEEKITSTSKLASIRLKFLAAKANLVIDGFGEAEVYIDGEIANETNSGKDVQDGILKMNGARLYELTNFGDEYEIHEVELKFRSPQNDLFAWTFG